MKAPQVLLIACAVDRACTGEMLVRPDETIRCTVNPQHAIRAADIAVCCRCDEAQSSDRYTIGRALAEEGWIQTDKGLLCDECTAICLTCADKVSVDDAIACAGSSLLWPEFHCPDCVDSCGACTADTARETAEEYRAEWARGY